MTLVIDCSVTLAWYFENESTPATDAVLAQVEALGAVAPSLWRLEVANGLQSALRRRRVTQSFRNGVLEALRRLNVEIDGETDAQAWGATLALADRFGLTPYDAADLELAIRRGLPLASLDRALRQAAGAVGVPLLGIAE